MATGCRSRSADPVIAKVGNSELHLMEVSYATSKMGSQDSAVVGSMYVEDWKKTASLYELAMKEQPDLDTLTQILIEKSRRQIVVQRFIDRQLEEATKRGEFKIDSADVKSFYDSHAKEFSFSEPSYRLLRLYTASADTAEKFGRLLNPKKRQSVDLSRVVPAMAPQYRAQNLQSITASQQFAPESRLHIETESMRDLLKKMNAGSVSPAIKLSDSLYAVMRVEEIAQKGEQKTFDQAYDEIAYLLRLRKEKAFYEQLRARAEKISQG